MTRIVLVALASLSLLAAQPAAADMAQRNPAPVISQMSEILKIEMGNTLAEEAAAVVAEPAAGTTKPAQK